ncbi:MAG: DinB family protein [Actinomycetota bacterium]|nr:DinB family protein [Actinomycetota bacterium]
MTLTNDCEACGFVDEAVTMDDAVVALRGFGRRYRAPLTRFLPGEDGDVVLRERPAPGVWSALEYAAHVGEVFRWYDEWVRRSLEEDDPVIDAPTPDEAAEEGRYNEGDPVAVADAIAAHAEVLATTFEGVAAEDWHRCHVRRGQRRSVLFTARRAVHEGNHHLLDIGRGMRAVRLRARGTGS